jgi:alkylation response protein AidB-like acyl-CoA dehydrogenase
MNIQIPTEQVKMMAELGFMGMMVDPKYGGSGLDSISYVLAMTEIKVDASAAVIMSVNNSLVCASMRTLFRRTKNEILSASS